MLAPSRRITMDLEEFRAFLAVVETGSFLAAATDLNVARATLRRRVESLEARAGVPLLERSARGVVVTAAGSLLATRGRLVVQEASALVASVRALGREPVGVLRVALPVGLPPHLLAPLFTAMRGAYPQLALQLRTADDPAAGPLDEFDVVAHFGPASLPGSWLTYEVAPLHERLIASADYLARRGTPTSVDALPGHELLSWLPPGEDGRVLPTRTGGSIEIEPALISADVHLIRQCVIAGLGIGFVPDAMLPDPGVTPGQLVPVLADVVGRERTLRVAVPSALVGLPKLQAVIRHVQAFVDRQVGVPG
jgi:DNA-binding transcriptional LysR family regulator